MEQEKVKDADSKSKYSGMRSELERDVAGKAASSSSSEQDQLKVCFSSLLRVGACCDPRRLLADMARAQLR